MRSSAAQEQRGHSTRGLRSGRQRGGQRGGGRVGGRRGGGRGGRGRGGRGRGRLVGMAVRSELWCTCGQGPSRRGMMTLRLQEGPPHVGGRTVGVSHHSAIACDRYEAGSRAVPVRIVRSERCGARRGRQAHHCHHSDRRDRDLWASFFGMGLEACHDSYSSVRVRCRVSHRAVSRVAWSECDVSGDCRPAWTDRVSLT